MEKRVLLAIFLSFLVLFVYQALVVPPRPPGEQKAKTEPPRPAVEDERRPVASEPHAVLAPPAASAAAARPARDIVVESDEVRAVVSTRGAVVTSWRLKKYLDERGEPLELVPVDLPGEQPRPFSLRFEDPALTTEVAQAVFETSADHVRVGTRPVEVALDYSAATGLRVRKVLVFGSGAEAYVVRVAVRVENAGRVLNPEIVWGPAIGTAAISNGSTYYTPPRAVFFDGNKVSRVRADKLPLQPPPGGRLAFAGVEDHYFLAAALAGSSMTVTYAPVAAPPPAGGGKPRSVVSFAVQSAEPGGEIRFFFGPKDFDILFGVQRDLVRAIDFGIFAWLVVPLLRALKWVNGYVGNYGWSIIILTVLINAAMFPLRHKSVVSMRKLQEIQPEVKAIQERYAKLKMTDPARQKMNAELMNLYRERGVNPASGCLPMLLTLPVLFAFYSLLSVAIELRRAPFIWWIRDLSRHDPLYITPILMGLTMVVQQRMTPSTGDPTQQRIMMLMPLMFTGMFLWAPSGLVIYWFVSNLWAIGQQYLTNRLIGPPRVRAARPAAERRLKRAAGREVADAGGRLGPKGEAS